MEDQSITVTFDYTKSEGRRALRNLAFGAKKHKHPFLGWVFVIVLGCVWYFVFHRSGIKTPPRRPPATLGFAPPASDFIHDLLVLAALVVLFMWFYAWRVLGKKAAKAVGKPYTYVFRPEGISVSMLYKRIELEWQAIEKFVESKEFFVLKTAPKVGLVIPKRVFGNEAELNRFRAMVDGNMTIPTARHAFPVTLTNPPMPPVGS